MKDSRKWFLKQKPKEFAEAKIKFSQPRRQIKSLFQEKLTANTNCVVGKEDYLWPQPFLIIKTSEQESVNRTCLCQHLLFLLDFFMSS